MANKAYHLWSILWDDHLILRLIIKLKFPSKLLEIKNWAIIDIFKLTSAWLTGAGNALKLLKMKCPAWCRWDRCMVHLNPWKEQGLPDVFTWQLKQQSSLKLSQLWGLRYVDFFTISFHAIEICVWHIWRNYPFKNNF